MQVTYADYRMLQMVRENPRIGSMELARRLGLQSRTVAIRLRRLKRRRFVRIQYNPHCVYTLEGLGYEVCEHYATQEHPAAPLEN